jgi:choline dehydrogenase-like flavoprotein
MSTEDTFEYVVVGSGAGGGTVAARLAEGRRRVLLLEAGGDPLELKGGDSAFPNEERLPVDYRVPAFHPFASENDAMRWDFFVRHYGRDELQQRDPAYVENFDGRRVDGVLYPRAGTLGGCTAHNAMITVYPHNRDWDEIAEMTGDASWKSGNMRKYFQRLERCRHRAQIYRWLSKIGINPTRHGFGGWLQTEKAIPKEALSDTDLVQVIAKSALEALDEIGQPIDRAKWALASQLDPNDWRLVEDNAVGLCYPPLATDNHARTGSRERVLDVARRHPDKLEIELDTLVTRVLFDDQNRAVGVEYIKGARQYRAFRNPSQPVGETRTVRVSGEVILSGGAFNTPQLLLLSGIGPAGHLAEHGIDARVDLPGVGSNLQDRYEVGIVNRMKDEWKVLKGARFAPGDPQYRQWEKDRDGVYATNGAVLAVIKRSRPERPLPDLFCFALLGNFRGYFPGYSKLFAAERQNYLTWAVLKAHTVNRAGSVRLRSADPRDTPQIDFSYFEEGDDTRGEDLDSVVDGIKFVRSMTRHYSHLIAEEELPGKDVQSDDELRSFVKDRAWGHHASCTCPIGEQHAGGVIDSSFRVHGVRGLRIVDASVFPKIPGFFIVSSVYTIGEKAADVILAQRD